MSEQPAGSMRLHSDAFAEGAAIPTRHTCDGDDLAPPLAWSDAPAGTTAFAIVMDDPDAPRGTWLHWQLTAIAATTATLAEGELPDGAVEGDNHFGRRGYGGPCPPPGRPHRYVFTLYALGEDVAVQPAGDAATVRAAYESAAIAQAQLTGTYGR